MVLDLPMDKMEKKLKVLTYQLNRTRIASFHLHKAYLENANMTTQSCFAE